MRDRATAKTRRPRKFRLWHLSVVVLLSSFLLAGIKALTRGPSGSGVDLFMAFATVWVVASSSLVFLSLGARLGHRATRGLKEWGLARGGLIGFSVWLVGLGVNLALALTCFGVGAVLLVGLVQVLLQLAG